jgi:hypothetical protein
MASWILGSAAATLFLLHLASSAGAQPATSLAIDVGSSSGCEEVSPGDEVEVLVLIDNVSELQTWEATIVYDRDILEIISQDNRQFLLEEPGSNAIDASEPLPDYNGRHLLSIGDPSASSESGDGILSIVVFKALNEGASFISIPQYDINGDGRTDEGARLTRQGGSFIGDVNGDGFFDGPVAGGIVAVDADCAEAGSPEPTDPPTPGPGPSGSGGGGSDTQSPGGPGPDGSEPPGGGPAESGTARADSPTPRTSGEPVDGTPISSEDDPDRSPDPDDRSDDENSGGGSFPLWLVAVLAASGLAGSAVVVFAVSRRV